MSTQIIDDLTGEPIENPREKCKLEYMGKVYFLDLTDDSAAELHRALFPFLERAKSSPASGHRSALNDLI